MIREKFEELSWEMRVLIKFKFRMHGIDLDQALNDFDTFCQALKNVLGVENAELVLRVMHCKCSNNGQGGFDHYSVPKSPTRANNTST